MHQTRLPWIVLVALLSVQALLVARQPLPGYQGDEGYYIKKARQLVAGGRFDRADARELAVERGQEWGTADFRPPGYPAIVALISAGNFDPGGLRARIEALQFAAMAATLLLAFALVSRETSPRRRLVIAIVFGIAPWPFEFVTSIVPDIFTAALTFAGIVMLAACRTAPLSEAEGPGPAPPRRATPSHRTGTMFAGALLMSATFLLRPEMIAIVPPVIVLALLLTGIDARRVAACVAAFALAAAVQYAYRIELTGERLPTFFSGFHTESLGAVDWANTWIGSEHEAYDGVVWAVADGQEPHIPPQAIADASERQALGRAIALVRRDGRNSVEVDAIFGQVADKRIRERPLQAWLLPRLAHIAQLWINTNTNTQLLTTLAPAWRALRRAVLGAILLLRCVIVAFFCAAVFALARRWRSRGGACVLFTLLAFFVVIRTVMIGWALNLMEHRYVLVAWPPLLACAAAWYAQLTRISHT